MRQLRIGAWTPSPQLHWGVVLACVLVGRPAPSQGQSVLTGVVRVDSLKTPLAGAEVLLTSLRLKATTDRLGRFSIDRIPAGVHDIIVRHIGHQPLSVSGEFNGHDTLTVEFSVAIESQRLAPITVTAPAEKVLSGKMEEFERRRKMGFGHFVTRADLQKLENYQLTNVLRRGGNIRFMTRPSRCGGGFAAASGRSEGRAPASLCSTVGYPDACYMAVIVDGTLLWATGQPDPPNIDDYRVDRVQGIEVYRGSSELPAEFGGTNFGCGAVVIWTRTGENAAPSRR